MKGKRLLLLLVLFSLSSCTGERANSFSKRPSSTQNQISSSSNESSLSISSASSIPTSSSGKPSSSSLPIGTYYHLDTDAILFKDDDGEYAKIYLDVPKSYLSFDNPSNSFSKELALASLLFVAEAPFEEKILNLYDFFDFEDLLISPDYSLDERDDTLKYVIGTKEYEDFRLINITLAGYDYFKPWKNNFAIGTSGNHEGFQNAALAFLPTIVQYIRAHGNETTKVFINGYSRSAAIGNIVSTFLLDSNFLEEEDLYAYLFETPKGIDVAKSNEYRSIFNIINSADIITYLSPEQYGHKRAGIDIDINKGNAETIVSSYNEEILINDFSASANYSSDVEFIDYFINSLISGDSSSVFSTRQNYHANVEPSLTYLIESIFSLDEDEISDLTDSFLSLDLQGMLSLLSDNGAYNFLSSFLDEHDVTYEEEELNSAIETIVSIFKDRPDLLANVSNQGFINNLTRSIYFHTLETVIPLVNAL